MQLGITAALGLVSAAVIMLMFLPAGLMLGEGKIPRKVVSARLGWIDSLVRGAIFRPKLTIGLWGAVVLSAALLTPRFRLETNLESLITQDLRPAAAKDLSRAFREAPLRAICSVSPTVEVRARGGAFLPLPGVARVDGVFQLIPRPGAGRQKQALLPPPGASRPPSPAPAAPI
ncbi:MAG: hypothetical protein IPI35_34870 [Deltaproteobacteria bacterium]|nr:hypothetical protein [Deltaproteobacteria bacterium]